MKIIVTNILFDVVILHDLIFENITETNLDQFI